MYLALCEHWRKLPPPALALKRLNALLSAWAGVPAEPDAREPQRSARQPSASPAPSPESLGSAEGMQSAALQAAMAGMPVFEGRPADPMLDFIPAPKADS